MDDKWLKEYSFKDKNEIQTYLHNLLLFGVGEFGDVTLTIADYYSSLSLESRKYFWEIINQKLSEKPSFITAIEKAIDANLNEYPLLPNDLKVANEMIFSKLRYLWNNFHYNPNHDDDDNYSINCLYFEIKAILGQIITSFPDIIEQTHEEWERDQIPTKYRELSVSYHIIEYLLKILVDGYIYDFFVGEFPELFTVQFKTIIENLENLEFTI